MIIIDCLTESGGWLGKLTALSTLGLLLVTAFYAVQTKRTVDLMKKQNESENKFKNTDLWDRALNEFFIPYKDLLLLYQMEIFENKQPDIVELKKTRDKCKELWRYWSYRVFDDKKRVLIVSIIGNSQYYENQIRSGAELSQTDKTRLIDDYQKLIDLFMEEIKIVKTRLKYEIL